MSRFARVVYVCQKHKGKERGKNGQTTWLNADAKSPPSGGAHSAKLISVCSFCLQGVQINL